VAAEFLDVPDMKPTACERYVRIMLINAVNVTVMLGKLMLLILKTSCFKSLPPQLK
jgi:hypothetical protein